MATWTPNKCRLRGRLMKRQHDELNTFLTDWSSKAVEKSVWTDTDRRIFAHRRTEMVQIKDDCMHFIWIHFVIKKRVCQDILSFSAVRQLEHMSSSFRPLVRQNLCLNFPFNKILRQRGTLISDRRRHFGGSLASAAFFNFNHLARY